MTKLNTQLADASQAGAQWVKSLKVGDVFNGAMAEANKRYNDQQLRDVFTSSAVAILVCEIKLSINDSGVIKCIQNTKKGVA